MSEALPEAGAPLVLYGHPRSGNVYKPALMLRLCDLPFEFRVVDLPGGEQGGYAYRALNALGQVPTLLHGDLRLTQSNAIVLYLARRFGRFLPADPVGEQRVLEWLLFEQDMLFVGVGRTRFFTRVTQGDPALVAWLRGVGTKALAHLDGALAGGGWLVGEAPSVADIVAYGYARLAEEGGFDVSGHAHLLRWRKDVEGLPGWAPAEEMYSLPPRPA